jgi:hypothetical protein
MNATSGGAVRAHELDEIEKDYLTAVLERDDDPGAVTLAERLRSGRAWWVRERTPTGASVYRCEDPEGPTGAPPWEWEIGGTWRSRGATIEQQSRSVPARRIHYTQVPAGAAGSPLQAEWETFRRELPRLLAEGHEGRHVLIKRDQIVGLWDTFEEAYAEGLRRFPGEPMAVQFVSEWQPLHRTGYVRSCR